MRPMEYTTRGEALTAAMELLGSTRKRLVVEEITNKQGNRRYCVYHPDGNAAIFYT